VFKKEMVEQYRTFRLLIVLAALLFFGFATPLLLKFLPDILATSSQQIPLQIPTFTAKDAILSYISNLGQIGLLIVVLVSMGAIASERERRTAVMTLSKPVGFGAFVCAKLASLAVLFGVGLMLGALGCYLYTLILLGDFNPGTFLQINLLVGLYLLVCISVTLMFSSFFKNQLAAGGLAFVTLIVLWLLSNLPGVGQAMPYGLMNWASSLANGGGASHWSALIVSLALVIVVTLAAWQVLRRTEL
jgi:ABC-2 type transport system permease protein